MKRRTPAELHVGPHETLLACEVLSFRLAVRADVRRVAPSRLGLLALSVQRRTQRPSTLLRWFLGHHRAHWHRIVLLSVAMGARRDSFGCTIHRCI